MPEYTITSNGSRYTTRDADRAVEYLRELLTSAGYPKFQNWLEEVAWDISQGNLTDAPYPTFYGTVRIEACSV